MLGSGAVLVVGGDQYPTIASALAVAGPGDIVRVLANEYKECIVLKDGITLEGPDRPLDEMPLASIDGHDACSPVILADASIVHGAIVKGFRVKGSPELGIHLTGAQGVELSGLWVSSPDDIPFLANHASFTLDHSSFRNCGGFGCIVLHGSKGVLVDNDIRLGQRGVVVDGGPRSMPYPSKSPSQAMLVRNTIHDNGSYGLWIGDTGSEVQAVGNVYERNGLANVHSGAGTTYRGVDETLRGALPSTANPSLLGVQAVGCELRCAAVPCAQNMQIVTEPASVRLQKPVITGNLWAGVFALCGADVDIDRGSFTDVTGFASHAASCAAVCSGGDCTPVSSPTAVRLDRVTISGSGNWSLVTLCGASLDLHDGLLQGNAGGVVADARWSPEGLDFHEPSTVRSRGTVFADNGDWAVIGYDSHLDLGTRDDPGLNSFLGSLSIANVSWFDVFAQWNWFGTADSAAIAATLGGYDIGSIHYTPFLTRPPAGRSTR
jgi:hypothetical protein